MNIVDIALGIYLVLLLWVNRQQVINFELEETFGNFLILSVFYLACRLIAVNDSVSIWVTAFLTALFILEVCCFCTQVFKINNLSIESSLHLSGSLQNSGLFGGLIVTLFPFVLYTINKFTTSLKRGFFSAISILVVMCIVALTQSRASALALFVVFMLTFARQRRDIYGKLNRLWRSLVLTIIISLSIFYAIFSYHHKRQSAGGRILIWKITAQHIPGDLFLGKGYGSFAARYNYWQADYFKRHSEVSTSEKKSADLSFVCFNAPLQLLSESGLVSLFLVTGLVIIGVKYYNSSRLKEVHRPYMISIAGTLTFSLFSYPFSCIPILLLFFLSLSIIGNEFWMGDMSFKLSAASRYFVFFCLLNFTFLFLYYLTNRIVAVGKWNKLQQSNISGETLIASYRGLQPVLSVLPLFEQEFGQLLYDNQHYQESVSVLNKNKFHMLNLRCLITLSKAYEKTNDLHAAEQNLLLAGYMVPFNLESRYELVSLYFHHGDFLKAKNMSKTLLKLPNKIESPAAAEMRFNLNRFLVTGRLNN
ncbi:O-antigen ligase family protein [Mucilaginibacter phyllosphaerae]